MADLILANSEKITKFAKINTLQNYPTVHTVLEMQDKHIKPGDDYYYYFSNVIEVSNSF